MQKTYGNFPEKKVVKYMTTPKPEPKKKQRYVRIDRVENMEKQGWKKVEEEKDKHERTLGVKTGNQSDLVLMEK